MNKYLVLSFLFLFTAIPVLSRGLNETGVTENSQPTTKSGSVDGTNKITTSSAKENYTTPSGNQVKNQVEVGTKNQGEDEQLSVKTKKSEQLNEDVVQSFTEVSDQVRQLIETTGAKGGIGQEVKTIAQSQTKLQDEIKTDFEKLNSRGGITKFLIGSDKKLAKSLEQKMEKNQVMIQQLEQLKLSTKNEGEMLQLQETIDLMVYQNVTLQDKVEKESKTKGIFGWLVNMFERN